MLHRLRFGMANPDYKKPLSNTVEADETYIGGNEKNRHQSKRNPDGFGGDIGRSKNKATVFGVVERKGNVVVKHIKNAKAELIQPIIIKNVSEFAKVITDEWYGYNGLNKQGYLHSTIKHALKQYVIGDIHTNTIENFWSVLKRNIYGIYHFTSRTHLQAYLEEVAYRFNNRTISDNARFDLLLRQSNIGVLKYRDLIKK